jgi:hypothetical protein
MYPYYHKVSTLAAYDKTAALTLYAPALSTTELTLTVNVPVAITTATSVFLSGSVTGGSGVKSVTWSSSAGASGVAVLNGPSWSIASIPLSIGLNNLTITAADGTGSVSRTVTVTRQTITKPLTGDTTPPTLNITSPGSTSIATSLASLGFSGTASDNAAVATVTWTTNTGSSGTATGTTQWTATVPLLVGSNTVTIRATDTSGNASWRTVVVTRR